MKEYYRELNDKVTMRYNPKQYAQALHQAITESAPADQDKILDNFAAVLKEFGDLAKLPEIEREFYNLERLAKRIKIVEIQTARPLGQAQEQKILEQLNKYIGAQVELKKQIEKKLIGGTVIRIDDEIIDGSVKRTLKDLKNTLIADEYRHYN